MWFGLIRPYFFEDNAGAAVMAASNRYAEVLRNFFETDLLRRRADPRATCSQQDGATTHTVKSSMNALRQMFPQHIISLYGDVQGPASLLDLFLRDYFIWGTLKVKCITLGL